MSSPLDAITYNQEAGYLPVNLVAGDDLSILISFPFDTTLYTFSGYVQDSFNNNIFPFIINPQQLTPTGSILCTIIGSNTALVPTNSTYFLQWSINNTVRTFLAGPMVATPK